MKKKKLFIIIPFFFVIAIEIYLLNGCQKDVADLNAGIDGYTTFVGNADVTAETENLDIAYKVWNNPTTGNFMFKTDVYDKNTKQKSTFNIFIDKDVFDSLAVQELNIPGVSYIKIDNARQLYVVVSKESDNSNTYNCLANVFGEQNYYSFQLTSEMMKTDVSKKNVKAINPRVIKGGGAVIQGVAAAPFCGITVDQCRKVLESLKCPPGTGHFEYSNEKGCNVYCDHKGGSGKN